MATEFRALARVGASVLAGIVDLIQSHEQSVLDEVDTGSDEVAALLADPEVDAAASVVALVGDQVLGLCLLSVIPAEREVGVDTWVSPGLSAQAQQELMVALMGDIGVRAAQLAAGCEPSFAATVATDRVASLGVSSQLWQLAAGAYREDTLWRAALQAAGLNPVRTFERLRIDHGREICPPLPPTGLQVLDATCDDDLRVVHRLHQQAFRDHWGGEPERPFHDWLAWQQSHAGYVRELWSVAYVGEDPVAFICASDIRAQFGAAYIPLLGVISRARGRGIAQYLLRREFARSAARGFAVTEITVDSASLTGADRLYRSVGMTPYRVMDVWLLDL